MKVSNRFQTFETEDSYFNTSDLAALRSHHNRHNISSKSPEKSTINATGFGNSSTTSKDFDVISGIGAHLVQESDSMPAAQEISTSESSSNAGGSGPSSARAAGGVSALMPNYHARPQFPPHATATTAKTQFSSPASIGHNYQQQQHPSATYGGITTNDNTNKTKNNFSHLKAWDPSYATTTGNFRGSIDNINHQGGGAYSDEASLGSEVPFDQRNSNTSPQRPQNHPPSSDSRTLLYPPPSSSPKATLNLSNLRTSTPSSTRPFDEADDCESHSHARPQVTNPTPTKNPHYNRTPPPRYQHPPHPLDINDDGLEESYHLQTDTIEHDGFQTASGGNVTMKVPVPIGVVGPRSRAVPHQHHMDTTGIPHYSEESMSNSNHHHLRNDVPNYNYDNSINNTMATIMPPYGIEDDDLCYRMPPPRISDPMLFPYTPGYQNQEREQPTTARQTSDRYHHYDDGRENEEDEVAADASVDVNFEESTTGNHTLSTSDNFNERISDDVMMYEDYDALSGFKETRPNVNSSSKRALNSPPSRKTNNRLDELMGQDENVENDDEEDGDSIFDFDEREGKWMSKKDGNGSSRKSKSQSRKANFSRKTNRSRHKNDLDDDDDADNVQVVEEDEEEEDDDDDDSFEVRVSLTERTKDAWQRKNARRHGNSKKSGGTSSPRSPVTSPIQGGPNHNPHGVHFHKDDTIHTFERDETETNATGDNNTISERSLNSEYTKSAESEVEDLIKDIFMIGSGLGNNPGRRKFKYNPHIKERLRQEQKYSNKRAAAGGSPSGGNRNSGTDEEETLETYDDDDDDEMMESSSAMRSSSKGGSTPTGINASQRRTRGGRRASDTGSSGLSVEEKKIEEDFIDDDPLSSVWNSIEGGINAVSQVFGLDDGGTDDPLRGPARCGAPLPSSRVLTNTPHDQDGGGLGCLFNYASEMLLGGPSAESCEIEPPTATTDDDGQDAVDTLETATSLEEDVRLVDLALQAARSMHKLRGYEFDESYDINIGSDIKFCVVDLSLPLGLIFQENETGCWVTKVLPAGSAVETGLVEVGDQLAAIDGISSIHMKVEQVSKIIRRKSRDIELTFLRYVGPLRPAPGTIAEEGYEVKKGAGEQSAALPDPNGMNRAISPPASPKRVGFLGIRKVVSAGSNNAVPRSDTKSTISARSPGLNTNAGSSRRSAATNGKERKGVFRLFGRRKKEDKA